MTIIGAVNKSQQTGCGLRPKKMPGRVVGGATAWLMLCTYKNYNGMEVYTFFESDGMKWNPTIQDVLDDWEVNTVEDAEKQEGRS